MKSIYDVRNPGETYAEMRQKNGLNSKKEQHCSTRENQSYRTVKVYLFKEMGESGLNLTYKLSSFYTKQILTSETLTKVYQIILSTCQRKKKNQRRTNKFKPIVT